MLAGGGNQTAFASGLQMTSKKFSCGSAALKSLCYAGWLGWLALCFPARAAESPTTVLTNVASVRPLAAEPQSTACRVHLEGLLSWVSPARDHLILQDDSGAMQVEMDLRNQPALQVGQRVLLEGSAVAGDGRLRETLIDNDGLHPPLEKTETIYLPAGRQPIQLAWFNGPTTFSLKLEYAGPGIERRAVPDSALWRMVPDAAGGSNRWTRGLEYRCYEGNWSSLPDFNRLPAVKTGNTSNFDLSPRTQDQYVALQFNGYLDVPRSGPYTFWLRSDDGSRLRVGAALRLTIKGPGPLPLPRRIGSGHEPEDLDWTEVEGLVTSLRRCPSGGMEAEISSGTNRVFLEMMDGSNQGPALFSVIRVRGVYRTTRTGEQRAQPIRLLIGGWPQVEVLKYPPAREIQRITRLSELRQLGSHGRRTLAALRVDGVVLAASPTGWLIIQDDTGAALVELDLPGGSLQPGQTIALEGTGLAEGVRVRMREAALVDNDGMHDMLEKSGTIFLRAGKHPLHLSWFNRLGPSGLEVFYEGPDLYHQPVPPSALHHAELEPGTGSVRWAPGLVFCCYEGDWTRLPDPGSLGPVNIGIATNFDIGLASRPMQVCLEFSGFVDVPRDGSYTFSCRSDDGSRLFVGDELSRLQVTGTRPLPAPAPLTPRQPLAENQEACWSRMEGTVTFASESSQGLELSLNTETGPMRVLVADRTGGSPLLLMNSRVRVSGLPQLTYTTDGQRVAGTLLTAGLQEVEIMDAAAHWSEHPISPIRDLNATNLPDTAESVVRVRGAVHSTGPGAPLLITDETGQILLETGQSLPPTNGSTVEALGRWSRVGTNVVLQCGVFRETAAASDKRMTALQLLDTIEKVKGLSRQEAERGYPVRARGIITAPLLDGFFLQGVSAAIYVMWPGVTNSTITAGDYWEVAGESFADFAPNIRATNATRLGRGTLPEPLRPTWDQLINGSLDARYVEVQGIVTRVDADVLTLLTRAGKISVRLPDAPMGGLRRYEGALIRVRGCIMPERNTDTQQVEVGRIRLLNHSITMDEPAPANPFAAELKRTPDLLLFDPRAGAIQRVRVAGQVVYGSDLEYYLMEGTNGLRLHLGAPAVLKPGDQVEAIGFPNLGGPSPALREAMVRRVSHAPLPAPTLLSPDNLLDKNFDATRVKIKARLSGVTYDGAGEVLELETGARGFLARLAGGGRVQADLLPGSLLELTGVYRGQGGDVTSGRAIDSFELLVNAPSDIKVLQRPSWWTLGHTLSVVGVMGLTILGTLVWISQLHRQVEERSRQLATAIRRQEHAESQRALESERARVARDLHDDLGAALTEIGLLGGIAQRVNTAPDRVREHLTHITDKAREMVTSLDEIVWSINPKHDSLASLSKYFCEYAQQFLQLTSVRCRLEVAENLPDYSLTSDQRTHLLLAFKEALTNVVRHAGATEVRVGIDVDNGSLIVTVADDGRGWDNGARSPGADGVDNLSRRLEELGGTCQIVTQAGEGTRVRMVFPLTNPTALGSGKP